MSTPLTNDLVANLRKHAQAWGVTAETADENVMNETSMARECARAANEIDAQTLRLNSYRQWLVDRVSWLKYEIDHGGDWKYLNLKREETAYCLEKFDALTALQRVEP